MTQFKVLRTPSGKVIPPETTAFDGEFGRMGTYRFERHLDDGAGREAGGNLEDDVSRALQEIDWVDHYAIRADASNEELVSVDVYFEEDWPDARAANPEQVALVFRRLGLRTLPNPALTIAKTAATDPLSAEPIGDDDAEDLDVYLLEE